MNVRSSLGRITYKNLPNMVSMLGVLPLAVLLRDGGYQYLIPLMIYNNVMDDLDGILAHKLKLKSDFGAVLDNVCDVIAHTLLVMSVGMHYGGLCGVASLIAVVAILVRVVSRVGPGSVIGVGSPTNELIRHMLFVLLLANLFSFGPVPLLIVVFILNAVSMLVPYRMPHMIRSLATSATAVAVVNVSLVAAWLVPETAPIIAACFIATYSYSLVIGGVRWTRDLNRPGFSGGSIT